MCGIAGRVTYQAAEQMGDVLGRQMNSFLKHRGPDGEGIYESLVNGHQPKGVKVVFGHRRLKVIDLRPEADQPMRNAACVEAGRAKPLVIVFNGEIYNFRKLGTELQAKGHRFQSQSDTEVILHLYEDHGIECLKYLRGMFAFALWDEKEETLFAARDRVGKKPFYYYFDGETFIFASEPRAILVSPAISAEPNLEAIHHYLTYGYIPHDHSAFRGIQKLPPAHYLVLRGGKLKVERYWKLSYSLKPKITEEEAVQEVRRRLREAVRLRLVSDVPLGAFLSGGIDSSAVVALMSAELGSAVKTFSIGFDEKVYDELPYARLIAQKFHTDHHEFVVKPDALSILPKIVWHYGEPFADSSAIPSFYLAEMTRQYVTVALNGDGGDENFAGYDRYVGNQLATVYDRLPKAFRGFVQRFASHLPPSAYRKTFLDNLKRFFSAAPLEPRRRYGQWLGCFLNGTKDGLCTPEFLNAVHEFDSLDILVELYDRSDAPDFVDATLDVDVNLYLPDDLLVKMDIATMAYGLEARSPLLDHELMEFVARLPSSFKLRGRTKKYILKKALQGLIPDEILNRRKMGFGVPLDRWFRKELKNFAYETLLGPKACSRGYFRIEAVRQLLDEHCSSHANHQHLLWNLLMLELWHKTYIDSRDWINGPSARF
jgi:asparagine synthase (glutamine-hydrolysing)